MPDISNTPPPENNRERIAKMVTYFVLWLTALVAIGAIIIIVSDTSDTQKFAHFKDVLAILLPLWGTWIGTVLAYYFSKDNFESANKSVQNLVNSITSDKKLESTKAKDVMIPIEKLIYKEYKTDTDDSTINLKTDFLDFINTNKISRVILLDENKCAKYVLHKSILEGFIAEQYFNLQNDVVPPVDPPVDPPAKPTSSKSPQALTLKDLKEKGNASVQAILKDGVKFIKEDANLSDAKILIKNYSACNDVFITKNGKDDEPILGWITNVTISENSIV